MSDRDVELSTRHAQISPSAPLAAVRDIGVLAKLMAPSPRHMQFIQAVTGASTLYAIFWLDVSSWWWMTALVGYFLVNCIGQSVMMHRALAHRAVRFPKPVEYAFSWLGMLGGAGSAIGFAAMHRAHHAQSDTETDPHALDDHGWLLLFSLYDYDFNPIYVRDLLRDRVHLFMHLYYAPLILAWTIALYLIDPLVFVFAYAVPAFLNITISNLGNIIGHEFGYRSHETRDDSTNNWLLALLTWGEGWHNNHHAKPLRANFQERWWEIDPGGMIINMMARFGLATPRL
ncbi:MAG: acyl-CoA desaturase [Pseudomonadota bacterium]